MWLTDRWVGETKWPDSLLSELHPWMGRLTAIFRRRGNSYPLYAGRPCPLLLWSVGRARPRAADGPYWGVREEAKVVPMA
jgi:hypothetical protein